MKFQWRKSLFGFLMIPALSLTALGCGGESLAEDVAAEVGGVQITRAQLDEQVEKIQQQLGEQVPSEESDPEGFDTYRREVLDYLVTLEIVTQKADEAGIEVTEEDVDEQLAKLKEPYGGDEAKFEQAIAQQNLSLEELRENLRQQGLITKMIEEVNKDIEVSDEEVATFYEEQKQELSVDETRRVSHILFSPENAADDEAEVTEADWQAALEEAQRARQQIVDGAAFAELAKQLSDDPGSKDEGGEVGVIERGALLPDFEDAVFGLPEGELSEPVRTPYGYHLIRVEEIIPEHVPTLEEAREGLRAQIAAEDGRELWEEWLENAKEELDVSVQEDLEYQPTTTEAAAAPGESDGGETTETTE